LVQTFWTFKTGSSAHLPGFFSGLAFFIFGFSFSGFAGVFNAAFNVPRNRCCAS
jgi:hypothetical protein